MTDQTWKKGPPGSILLTTDLSARGDRALDRAVSLAKQWQSRLTLLHVLDNIERSSSLEALPSWRRPPDPVQVAKKNIAEDLSDVGDTAKILVEEGDVVDTIMRVAESERSELIVAGIARNEIFGEINLGQTVSSLLRRSQVPLLVVKNRPRRPYRKIVVATDFSDSSRNALVAAANFFAGQPLTLFHAYHAPMAHRVGDAADYRREWQKTVERDCEAFLQATGKPSSGWQRPQVLIEHGEPNELLRDYVTDNAVDLVVVSTHGRSAVFDFFIGSVAKRILSDVPSDILVIREPLAKVEA